MTPEKAREVLKALHALGEANWVDFARDPALCCAYEKDLRSDRFRYVDDKYTCGRADCWSTYADLRERYRGRATIPLDCEDAACSYAAWMVARCYDGWYVGLVPGKRVSHCVAGCDRGKGIEIVDPALWFGMRDTTYEGAIWKKLAPKLSRPISRARREKAELSCSFR